MDITRRQSLTGLAGILAAGVAPAAVVRSMIGARNAAMFGDRKITTRDYIQSHLIAMWDGEENVSRGVHDPTATNWTDLISGIITQTVKGSLSFGDKYAYFDGLTYLNTNTLFGKPQKITLEVDAEISSAERFSALISSIEGGGCGFQQPNIAYGSGMCAGVGNPNGGYYSWPTNVPLAPYTNKNFSLSVGSSIVFSANGSVIDSISSVNGIRYNNSYCFQIGTDPGDNGRITGRIYNIRVYDEANTIEQAIYNYSISKKRFGWT